MTSITPKNVANLPGTACVAVDVVLDTAYQNISTAQWNALFASANKLGLPQFITDLFAGKHVNQSENRPALHSALRNLSKTPVILDGKDVMPAVVDVWKRMEALCNKWVGVTDVIHIGIGGSDFGPRLAIEALAHVPEIESRGMRMHFLANIDTAELARILAKALPHSTRVVIVSKSFTTLETTMNAKAVVGWLKENGLTNSQINKALYAVTANVPEAKAFGVEEDHIFPFWDWVGGRYSVWSAVGLPIALPWICILKMPHWKKICRSLWRLRCYTNKKCMALRRTLLSPTRMRSIGFQNGCSNWIWKVMARALARMAKR